MHEFHIPICPEPIQNIPGKAVQLLCIHEVKLNKSNFCTTCMELRGELV